MVRVVGGGEPQWCSWCGAELVLKYEEIDYYRAYRLLECPNKRAPRFWQKEDKHASYTVDVVKTILNYDPYTGEEIKRK